ncbi:hypothetical protein SLU01_09390 [Sporosarcina luteola]|uniref:Uncharacterized protein n=1 Tax=Sporosarcina luteola TaxID=582850 RepID=A0A511Z597_9BACL|nr:hypothetical protein SLU01_09390 [Sporosarcina luteola]
MLIFKEERWRPSIVGWGMFVFATILNLIIEPNLPSVLGFLTAAIIIFIANIIYVLYTNKKSIKGKNK